MFTVYRGFHNNFYQQFFTGSSEWHHVCKLSHLAPIWRCPNLAFTSWLVLYCLYHSEDTESLKLVEFISCCFNGLLSLKRASQEIPIPPILASMNSENFSAFMPGLISDAHGDCICWHGPVAHHGHHVCVNSLKMDEHSVNRVPVLDPSEIGSGILSVAKCILYRHFTNFAFTWVTEVAVVLLTQVRVVATTSHIFVGNRMRGHPGGNRVHCLCRPFSKLILCCENAGVRNSTSAREERLSVILVVSGIYILSLWDIKLTFDW